MAEYCCKCGQKLKEKVDKFCYKCGAKVDTKDANKDAIGGEHSKVPISLDDYKSVKGAERASHFKSNKKSASSSTTTSSSSSSTITSSNTQKHMVSINIGLMKVVDQSFKPIRGKKLPLKVDHEIDYLSLKKAAIVKHSNHDQLFCGLEDYVLLYPDGKQAYYLPGSAKNEFKLNLYKEELGKPYSQIILYLIQGSEFDDAEFGIGLFG